MTETAAANADHRRELLQKAERGGWLGALKTYSRLSGPGWLQSALTLGGGSLAGSLYLGVIGGYSLLWLQPVAVIIGVVMLGAISYITLSTRERPFEAMRRHISPLLAWSWVAAAMLANLVWCMPQYALAVGVMQQNLAPGLFGADGAMGYFMGKVCVTAAILAVTAAITFCYGAGGLGVQIYEGILKTLVMLIILCFIGVVARLALVEGGLDWGAAFAGLVPNFALFTRPDASYEPFLNAIADPDVRDYWTERILQTQSNVMIAATATAVGINMTFLMPYSLLRRGWDKAYRGFSIFDLATGMMLPFIIATGCIIIAAGASFHLKPAEGLLTEAGELTADEAHPKRAEFLRMAAERDALVSAAEHPWNAEERFLAASLITRDAGDLSDALAPLTGETAANFIFGFGVLAMTLSSITLLMVISGMIVCEVAGKPHTGTLFRMGSLLAAVGVLGPFLWSGAKFYLAVPTSVFNYMLLPLAYAGFLLMMNSKRLMGDERPAGAARWIWNILMGLAAGLTTVGAVWQAGDKGGWLGLALFVIFGVLVVFDAYRVKKKSAAAV